MSKEKWVVTAAWPYVNTVPHLGTMLQLLSGDVITRYRKLKKDEVVYVSGSDAHGTPIVVAAEAEGISPNELALKYHNKIVQLLADWNIDFDKYTITTNPTHISYVQELHKKIHENGYYVLKESEQYYCNHCNRFLPDRFVEG
ncbi:MAG: class I tRNA ligase family protein [Candidatus Heimdallarchaeota archaeon]|nr:class I tRNA ligase family protein [Candidatus Heimdallarchaeota archaeon]MCK4253947.1 class I tRNA ligase family protein [Candidatus Heimdallarchaeota archaeon]